VSKEKPTNLAASVRQRLLNLSRQRGEDFNLILNRYAVERLLYRLSLSAEADLFILKGATLFAVWTGRAHRPTRDLDLLGHGDASAQRIAGLFQRLCEMEVEPDGLHFDPASIRVEEIREDQEYGGQRVKLVAMLGAARIDVQTDIGFGDVVTPAATRIEYPTLLELPAPMIRAYPRETAVAEKLHAMVALGMLNTRMKDFYDVRLLAGQFAFEGATLAKAIKATFVRRGTPIPTAAPTALTSEFSTDRDRVAYWKGFLRRSGLEAATLELDRVVEDLRGFLIPPMFAAAAEVPFEKSWPAGGPWSTS